MDGMRKLPDHVQQYIQKPEDENKKFKEELKTDKRRVR